jgi:hypothetical protein
MKILRFAGACTLLLFAHVFGAWVCSHITGPDVSYVRSFLVALFVLVDSILTFLASNSIQWGY